jgi:hypothetical protein
MNLNTQLWAGCQILRLHFPRVVTLVTANHLLKYLNGTLDLGLVYSRYSREGSDRQDKSSVALSTRTGRVVQIAASPRWAMFKYGVMLNDSAVSWKSTKQSAVALSSVESEFVAYTHRFLENLDFQQPPAGQNHNDGLVNLFSSGKSFESHAVQR